MKAYTDLNQSKKLAEILSIESADMYYAATIDATTLKFVYTTPPRVKQLDQAVYKTDIPCWGLAALLIVLPSVIKRKEKRMFLTLEKAGAYNLYYKSPDRLDELWETKEEPVDACVAMIENLHEQKIL